MRIKFAANSTFIYCGVLISAAYISLNPAHGLAQNFEVDVLQQPIEASKTVPISVDAYKMVRAHNIWRAKVGLPGLHWSKELASQAARWADELARQGCAMTHSSSKFGENLFWASPLKVSTKGEQGERRVRHELQEVTEQQVVDSWASEQQWYSHKTNTCNAPPGKGCGHYTQVVWRNTSEVGCARAVCSDNSQIWVCNYAPAGNIIGQRPY